MSQATVANYFALLLAFATDEWTLQSITQYYGYSPEEYAAIAQEPLARFLYEMPQKTRIETIYHLRNSFQRVQGTPEQFDATEPLALALYTRHIKSLQMFRTEQFHLIANQEVAKSFESSVRAGAKLKKPQISLIPVSHLGLFQFPVADFDKLLQLPMIMLDLERQVVAHELCLLMVQFAPPPQPLQGIDDVPPEEILQATQTPGYSPSENYEALETVGDSLLKYISSLVVFEQFAHYRNEDFLTFKRAECKFTTSPTSLLIVIANNMLGQIMYESNFDRFLKVQFSNYIEWLPPALTGVFGSSQQQQHECPLFSSPKVKLTTMLLADVYEAILGACFMAHHSFRDPYRFLAATNHPLTVAAKPLDHRKLIDVAIALPLDSTLPLFDNPETTFRQLCPRFHTVPPESLGLIETSIKEFLGTKSGDDFFFLEYFQNNILHYRFNNPQLLVEAITFKPFNHIKLPQSALFKSLSPSLFQDPTFLGQQNYEKLEFLGDAVIEALVVPNAYLGLQKLKIQITPDLLSKIKMTLLGNSFMARQCVANSMHHFLLNKHGGSQEVVSFLKLVNFDQPFKDFVGNLIAVPKCLSDIWESLCGAILLDGGWSAVLATYGVLYQPFVQFICKFIFEIEDHVILKVHHYCQERFQHFEFLMKDNRTCQIIADGNVQVEEQGENEKVAKEKAARKFCEKFSVPDLNKYL